jgi:hypothetical protein
MKSRHTAVVAILTGVFFAICLSSSPSNAYCVYNHTNAKLVVCGESCLKCYNKVIKGGHHGCCPGGHKGCGGHTFITIYPYISDGPNDHKWFVPVQVTSHGWVSLFGKCKGDLDSKDYCSDVTAKVHNNDGDIIYSGEIYRYDGHASRCRND